MYAIIFWLKVAKEKGAQIERDIWEEEDEYGVVRLATVRTVSLY